MNGAESLVRTLVGGGVNVCFANPGTSEMHFVAALDRVDGMRCVLGLFEGVVTGAADGYSRMSEGPGGDAAASRAGLRQRRRQYPQRQQGGVGDGQHRRRPRDLSPPIRRAADLGYRDAGARPIRIGSRPRPTRWRSRRTGRRRSQAARTPPGQIATLILPADTAWNEGSGPVAGAGGAGARASRRPKTSRRRRGCCARASRRCCC